MNSSRRRSASYYFIIGSIIVALVGVAIWQIVKYRLVNKKVKDAVSEKTHGLYSLTYDSLLIDEVGGTLKVSSVNLLPDTVMYAQMKAEHKNPPVLITLHIPGLTVNGVRTPKALLEKEIAGGKIEINDASIEIGMADFLKDTTEYSPGKELYQQILGGLKSIRMDSVQINHSTLVVRDLSTGKTRFTGKDFSILLTGLQVDSSKKDDSSRILFSNNLDVSCKDITLNSPDHKYRYQFQDLRFQSQFNLFSVREIAIIPQLGEQQFADSYQFSIDRLNFQLHSISLTGINREALWHKRLLADSLIIGESRFKVFRDISKPHDSVNRVGTYPQQLLMKLSMPLSIRKLVMHRSFIEYKEKNAKSDSSGKVQFDKVEAVFTNVTNIGAQIRKNHFMTLDFSSLFLNQGAFKARWTMNLIQPNEKFDIVGSLSAMPLTSLNVLAEPMGLAKIEQGNLDGMNFHLYGVNYSCSGDLLFRYHDLKVSLLKKDEDKNVYKKKGLASLAANILVKNSNPANGKTRPANMNYKRDIHRSVFNLMWKTLFTGIKQTAGM